MNTLTTKKALARLGLVIATLAGAGGLAVATAPAASATPACEVLAPGAAPEAEDAVDRACDYLGTPYLYGGGHGAQPGPTGGGLDCSGLTRVAYARAVDEDIINGTTYTQWDSPRRVARFSAAEGFDPLLPGDLVFFSNLEHVGIYLGEGYMVEAPTTGIPVRVASVANRGYYGAVRLYEGGPHTSPADRIAFAEGDHLWAREGALDAANQDQDDDVKKFQLEGDRVGVLTPDGELRVKEGDLGPGWATINTDSVTDFELDGERIAFTEGQDLYIKEGGLDAPLVHQDAAVAKFQIEGDRVGVLTPDGVLKVKEGDLEPGWVDIATGVTSFQLHGARIAYTEGNVLWAQDGALDAPSEQQESGVAQYQLSGDRVAVLTTGGALEVKAGDLGPGWLTVSPNSVTSFQLDSGRIAFAKGGDLYLQEGALSTQADLIGTQVDGYQIDGDRVAGLKGGALYVTEGDLDEWVTVDPDSVTAFQIGADLGKPVRVS
ncbi:C40 family peptidase [Actinokineospora sp. NBRC 105648]|uniref:C40 family peptidase n=1 Tax=Actinokineospora sp. NBRC 105648 TaxID=3032206 RepID=UPI0024A43E6F|nr:C40 family peptidase [Actinokineospora sp. NBRC 105648]GLZ40440.1 hypothetical protein Acsp05_40640 [Actinokineospora sp. NBRC 105648]